MSMNTNDACIIIASHISNPKRISHLFECLTSLLNQTIKIPIYLSISFETEELKQAFAMLYSEQANFQTDILSIIVKAQKTPQMRHMEELMVHIEPKHQWVMFCDDDDTYQPNRVHVFLQNIVNSYFRIQETMPDKQFIGAYESTFGKDHKEQRHEFWCYCVHISVLKHFIDRVKVHPDVLDHKCCDVFFGEYLRRSHPDKLFCSINIPLYNYRVENNSDSITGVIQTQNKYVRKAREITYDNMQECANELNEYLNTEIGIYIHDTYLRTIVGNDLQMILKNEFKSEVQILHLVDQQHVFQIMDYHNRLREICNELYDIKI